MSYQDKSFAMFYSLKPILDEQSEFIVRILMAELKTDAVNICCHTLAHNFQARKKKHPLGVRRRRPYHQGIGSNFKKGQ